jgi:hypothetical protein
MALPIKKHHDPQNVAIELSADLPISDQFMKRSNERFCDLS